MNKFDIFLKKHSSTILSIIGSCGVIATAVLAVKATPKALKEIELAKKYPSSEDETLKDAIKSKSITPLEIVKATWKVYLPSILVGSSTILCIFGSNYINKKNQKELMSAYALLSNTYLNFRESTNRLYGPDAEQKILNNMIETREIEDTEYNSDDLLFFDMQSMRYFRSTVEKVKNAEKLLNELISKCGYAYLNDLYDLLEIPQVDYGYQLGWSTEQSDSLYSHSGIIFDLEQTEINNDVECYMLTFSIEPSVEFLY